MLSARCRCLWARSLAVYPLLLWWPRSQPLLQRCCTDGDKVHTQLVAQPKAVLRTRMQATCGPFRTLSLSVLHVMWGAQGMLLRMPPSESPVRTSVRAHTRMHTCVPALCCFSHCSVPSGRRRDLVAAKFDMAPRQKSSAAEWGCRWCVTPCRQHAAAPGCTLLRGRSARASWWTCFSLPSQRVRCTRGALPVQGLNMQPSASVCPLRMLDDLMRPKRRGMYCYCRGDEWQ